MLELLIFYVLKGMPHGITKKDAKAYIFHDLHQRRII